MLLLQRIKISHHHLTTLLLTLFLLAGTTVSHADAPEVPPKVMVLDYQLNDMTGLPNAPEELERISFLSATFKQKLAERGVEIVQVNDTLNTVMKDQSATYLFDNVETAAEHAKESGADYLLICVALKPTYLFVYPRILLVDIKTRKVVLAKAAQLESSWTDKNTTARTAEKLADMVSAFFSKTP